MTISKNTKPNWQSYPISIISTKPVSQRKLMQYLLDHGIATRRGIMNAHEEKPYQNKKWSLPLSGRARKNTILLPLHHELEKKDVAFIVNTLAKFQL